MPKLTAPGVSHWGSEMWSEKPALGCIDFGEFWFVLSSEHALSAPTLEFCQTRAGCHSWLAQRCFSGYVASTTGQAGLWHPAQGER
ncbi:hypothetical protein Pla111_09940 [Botrimarina hoheduenensis]|uniref:Uncharacterized protein n=1 Tax=Botrimarina hoheduenensis TaxID=2528000 RepID=A0A5C5WBH8_9BACT|nr:hypothetical protein Pla111_09940 [Botrimarina hoheduenensis]